MLAIAVIITMLLILINKILGVIGFVLTIWVYYFFRDPERYPINDESFLVSPADGVISLIANVRGPIELNMENKEYQRVSVFMNVFNCHVNRVPVTWFIDENGKNIETKIGAYTNKKQLFNQVEKAFGVKL